MDRYLTPMVFMTQIPWGVQPVEVLYGFGCPRSWEPNHFF